MSMEPEPDIYTDAQISLLLLERLVCATEQIVEKLDLINSNIWYTK